MKAALVRVARPCAEAVGKLHPPVWVTAIRKSGLSGLAAIHGSLNPPGATPEVGADDDLGGLGGEVGGWGGGDCRQGGDQRREDRAGS